MKNNKKLQNISYAKYKIPIWKYYYYSIFSQQIQKFESILALLVYFVQINIWIHIYFYIFLYFNIQLDDSIQIDDSVQVDDSFHVAGLIQSRRQPSRGAVEQRTAPPPFGYGGMRSRRLDWISDLNCHVDLIIKRWI